MPLSTYISPNLWAVNRPHCRPAGKSRNAGAAHCGERRFVLYSKPLIDNASISINIFFLFAEGEYRDVPEGL